MDVEELKEKVRDHDTALVTIAKSVEDINKHLERFADTNESLQKNMTKHWHNQDMMNAKLENILTTLTDDKARIKAMEKTQLTGCAALVSFKEKRDIELKMHVERFENQVKRVSKMEEKIDAIEAIPNKILWRVAMVASGAIALFILAQIGLKA